MKIRPGKIPGVMHQSRTGEEMVVLDGLGEAELLTSFPGNKFNGQFEDIKAKTKPTVGTFLSQVPSSFNVGPLGELYNIIQGQGGDNPLFSGEESVGPLGQMRYRYSVSLPQISSLAVTGDWKKEISAALTSCAVSSLEKITLQSRETNVSAPPINYYRIPLPGQNHSVVSSQSRRMADLNTAHRKTEEEPSFLTDDDPLDFTKLSNSLDKIIMNPNLALAVPHNQKDIKEEILHQKI